MSQKKNPVNWGFPSRLSLKNSRKFAGMGIANSGDPDQTAPPLGAV